MRRIRLVFFLIAVLLLVPMALLVRRAFEGIALERRVSHRAVAERLFDEMERELSRILRAEEERPFSDYRFDAFEDAARGEGRSGAASQPAGSAALPYVVGYFQIDPDGRFSSPPLLWDRAGGPGREDRRASQPPPAGAGRLEDLVERGLRKGAEEADAEDAADQFAHAPGTTRALGGDASRLEREAREVSEVVPGEAKAQKQVSPYEALQALNKGADWRSERQVKLAARGSARAEAAEVPPLVSRSLEGTASAAAPSPASAGRGGRPSVSRPVGRRAGLAREAEGERSGGGDGIFEPQLSQEATLEVHPMVGRLIDDEHLLLYRMVFLGEKGYRQGLVVNVPALVAWLDETVLAGSELSPFVRRDFFTPLSAAPSSEDSGGFRYQHRFAEPFDALAIRMTLEPLPDVGGAGYLYAISVLLLVSGSVGLLALYRMVAVTVRFAERRNNFVAAVSHELKTPLTAIRMYGEMLRDGMVSDDDRQREYYGTITAESERLTRLINNVLEFSRLEQGTREMNFMVGQIGPVVREAVKMLEPHAREAGFGIEVDVAEGLPPVRFDRDALLQVVFNLVDNALKYAREAGDRVIAVRCVRAGETVVVSVRDRGPGVSARHLSKIFEPFYRGGDELTRTAKGTGIGLALVRGLAETMGAAVAGRNVAGGGFEVELSFRAAAAS